MKMKANKGLLPYLFMAAPMTLLGQTKQPNIILFIVDDMGWQDTSVPFYKEKTPNNEKYKTPNMERLAREGMLFSSAYASSVSSPSRCSLLSGMNAARHRVTNWTLERNKTTDYPDDQLDFVGWNVNGLASVRGIPHTTYIKSFVELLREAGYHTMFTGKAHFGAIDTPGENPIHFGFEVNIAGHAAGGTASFLGEENFGNKTDGSKQSLFAMPGMRQYWGQDIFATEALTLESLKLLDKAKAYGQPFFLYLGHYAVHVPMTADKRFYQKYIDEGYPEVEARYASMVEGMDKSLGDILDWLEKNGERENTLFIFLSDNGGLAASTRAGRLHVQNAPLRSGKGSAYEGGTRIPMIVSWPKGKVEAGVRTDKPVLIEDLYPTILAAAGVEHYKVPQKIDGENFLPILKGEKGKTRDRSLLWNFPNKWVGEMVEGIAPTASLRHGDYKIIYYWKDGRFELFNLAEDIGEQHDLSKSEPVKLRAMAELLTSELKAKKAQRPRVKATGEPVLWPIDKLKSQKG